MKNVEYNALLKMHLCGLKAKYFPRTVYSKTRNFLFKQLELSEGTSRALRILNKGREYLLPKPEEDLDAESAEEHSDLPEQSSESSSDETSESSCESYNVDEDESSEELSSEEETETASMVERAQTTSDEVPSNLAVVLGEGISQISESDYQTALASTSSADDVVNTVQSYDNIEDDMQQYVNDNCSGKWRFNTKSQSISGRSTLLSLKVNTKRRNVVLTVSLKTSKMRQWLPNYIAICNHSIKESSASVTLGE